MGSTFSLRRNGDLIGTAGELDARWVNAGVAQAASASLGSYRVTVRGAEDGVALAVGTTEGALRVAGTGEMRTFTRAPLRLVASAQPEANPDAMRMLQPLLANLGTPGANGQRVLDFTLPALLPTDAPKR
jgi:hypothetical protein